MAHQKVSVQSMDTQDQQVDSSGSTNWIEASKCDVTESCIDKLAIKEDTCNYCRLILLMVDVGTETLRYLFYLNIPKHNVKNYFASKKTEIDKKKLFDKTQYAKLFGADPNPDDYDISLLIKLLLHFQFGSSSGDLERLRAIRNDIVGHKSKAVLTNQYFEKLWSEVKTILLSIAKSISTEKEEETKMKIEEQKHKVIDVSNREMKIIKAFEAQYHEDIVTLQENMSRQQEDIVTVREDLSKIQRDVANLQRDNLNRCEDKGSVSLEVKSSQHLAITQDMLNGCRTEVIDFYRTYEAHHPLSPWHDQYNAVLTEMYVNPPMCCIEYNDLTKNKETTPVKSYRDIFYKHSERCHNIFMISLPGAGKTTLCKWMKLMWCQAHKPIAEYNTFFAEEDLAIMKEFDFLFHVPLRNFSKTDHYVDDMIQEEILNCIGQREANVLQDILNAQTCLVVLDGLDEYTSLSPNFFKNRLPHLRKPRKICIVITTRSWKFYDLQLKDYQVDQLVKINKFGDSETDSLTDKVISCLNKKSKQNKKPEEFRKELQKVTRQDIVSIPILLMQLVCLWYENKPLGRSHCETYTNMLELLFHWSATLEQLAVEDHEIDFRIPNCFSGETRYCRNNMQLLQHLGHLAFNTLFTTCHESSLVFEASLVKRYLSDEEMSRCLKIGILLQSKITGLISSRCTVEFFHKTFQEFLSAFYIFTRKEDEQIQLMQLVIPASGSIKKILEASEILIFLSGLCPLVVNKISTSIEQIILNSALVRVHRESLINYWLPLNEKTMFNKHQLNRIGDLFIKCVTESRANNCEIPYIPIQDVFYCGNEDGHYIVSLQYLLDHNADSVKSLCVRSDSKALQKLSLENLNKLECLYVRFTDEYNVIIPEEKMTVLTKSVPTLMQLGLSGAAVHDKFVSVIQSCQYLQSVEFIGVEVTHKHMEELMLFLSQKTDLKEISLKFLNCTEHPVKYKALVEDQSTYKNPECLHKLNLTQHNLVHLKLMYIGFNDLSVNTYELKYCLLGGLSTDTVSTILGDPSHLPNLEHLSCQCMWSSETIQCIVTTLPSLVQLVYIFFCDVDIRNKKFVMSSRMKNLKNVCLESVLVNLSTLYQLLNSLSLIERKILVEVCNCKISPQGDSEMFKHEILNSQRYIVNNDYVDMDGNNLFCFYTNGNILPSHWQAEQDAILTGTISQLNKKYHLDKKADKCKMELKKLIRQDIVTIPEILKLLVTLWYENKPLGQSQCEMYAIILEVLFHRCATLGQLTKGQVGQFQLPKCFSQNFVCYTKSMKLLHKLGHMAFDALFSSCKARTLFIQESEAKKYLSKREICQCLKTEILLKIKVTGLGSNQHMLEFLHKTFQEFLSTLYIYMSEKDVQLKFARECPLEHVLKESEILTFLSGLCPSLVSQIFRTRGISDHGLTQKHRGSLGHYIMPLNYKTENLNDHPLKVLQDLFVNCVTESRANNSEILDIPIQDVFYCGNEESHYIASLQHLLDHSTQSVKSLCIKSDKSTLQKVNFKNLNNLECLYIEITDIEIPDDLIVQLPEEMTVVWKKSLSTLKQVGLRYVIQEDGFVEALQSCQALELFSVKLTHSHIKELMLFLSQKTDLKELSLGNIMCTDHKELECLDRLNLTHCQLEYLRLKNVGIIDVNIISHKLKYCELRGECHAAVSGVLGTPMLLPALEYLTCGCMESSDTIGLIVTTLSSLVNLKYINLIGVDIRDKKFVFGEKMKLERFCLCEVSVTLKTLHELVNSLERINGRIYVLLRNCKMCPQNDFSKFKQEIHKRYFVNDKVDDNGSYVFSFVTKESTEKEFMWRIISDFTQRFFVKVGPLH